MAEENCLFCKIIAGQFPASFVHQDEHCVVIRDINPQAPMHMLVIPREHIESLDEVSQREEMLMGDLLLVGARVTNDEGHAESGYRSVINTGAGEGQSVFHLHVHVLAGRPMNWPPG